MEIPFIKLDDVEEVKEVLATGGCKPGVCGPRVRTITACQGSAVCPSGNIDSYDIAKKLDERYFARELPHKFKFGVTACPTDAWKATPAFEVSFGGLFGNRVYKGENYLPLVTSEEQLFRITDAAIQFFDDNANPGERFRMTLERVGLDKFEEKIKEAYNG